MIHGPQSRMQQLRGLLQVDLTLLFGVLPLLGEFGHAEEVCGAFQA